MFAKQTTAKATLRSKVEAYADKRPALFAARTVSRFAKLFIRFTIDLKGGLPMPTETLDHGTRVYTAPGATFGTDAILLGRFATPKRDERALDLCSGCGIVALLWHDAGHRGACTALELMAPPHALLAEALAANGITHITALQADLRDFCTAGPDQGRFDFVACNPPYFSVGSGRQSPEPLRATARHTGSCTLTDVAACAARCLKDGGRFALCHRPDQLAEVFATLRAAHLEPKRLQFVKHTAPKAPTLFLVEAQKNRRPGLVVLPDLLTSEGATKFGRGCGE